MFTKRRYVLGAAITLALAARSPRAAEFSSPETTVTRPAVAPRLGVPRELPLLPASIDRQASGNPAALPGTALPAAVSESVAAAQASPAPAPSAPLSDEAVRGKTLLLVGTRGSRPFILEEAVRVANELGLRLLLLDKAENRKNSEGLVPDADFIAAPIDKRDDKTTKAIAEQVQALAQQRRIDHVIAFRSHHAKLVGKIVDAAGISGLTSRVALTSEDKARTRKALNAAPEQFVPYAEVKSVDEVRQFFRQHGGDSAKFVMKSKLGENSRFVELGIDSEEGLVSAFQKMDSALRAEAKRKEASDTIFNRYPGVIVERMLEPAPGTVEASVELVVQNGKTKFAMVSDTHGIGLKGELAGGSMTFPSQMTQEVQQKLIAASAKALELVGIRDGNARIDIMMTKDGPKIIEVNPFLGGAAIYTAVKLVTGVSLIEWGIRSILGLSLPEMPANRIVVDYRFAASQNTGEILSITGENDAKAVPGVAHVQLLAAAGDSVKAPVENGYEEWAEIMGTGETFEKAKTASIDGLSKIKAKILAEQTADYLQPRWILGVAASRIKETRQYGDFLQMDFKNYFYYRLYRILSWILLPERKVKAPTPHHTPLLFLERILTPKGAMDAGRYEFAREVAKLYKLPGVISVNPWYDHSAGKYGEAYVDVVFSSEESFQLAKKRLPERIVSYWVRAYVATLEGRKLKD